MILDRLLGVTRNIEQRATLRNPVAPDLWDMFTGGGTTASGESVNEATAMGLAAYYAAIRAISEDVAKLPLPVYKRLTPQGKERDTTHPVYTLLNKQPNPDMTAISFRQTLMQHALGWGNGYAEIIFGTGRIPIRLNILEPIHVRPEYNVGRALTSPTGLQYRIIDVTSVRIVYPENMLHLPGLGFDGVCGYSVARLAKESLGLALATQKSGAALFGAGSRPGGTLTHPGHLSDEGHERLRTEWERTHGGGAKNAHRTALLEEGVKFESVATVHKDSQWIEARQFSIEEIARWFRMPPHKLQHLLRATFSNITEQAIEYVVDCLQSWLIRFEQEVNRKLFTRHEPNLFVEHLIDGLLRGDPKARNEAYEIQRRNGIINADEWRARENMNPLPDGQGQVYIVNAAMVSLDTMTHVEPVAEEKETPTVEPETGDAEDTKGVSDNDIRQWRASSLDGICTLLRWKVQDAYRRVVRYECDKIARRANKDGFREWLDEFYVDHLGYVRVTLGAEIDCFVAAAWQVVGRADMPDTLKADVTEYTRTMAVRYIQRSQAELTYNTDIPTLLKTWRTKRVGEEIDQDLHTLAAWIRSAAENLYIRGLSAC